MRRRPSSRAACGLLAAILLALAGSAVAFFSGSGAGSASAAVTQLSAPTISAATPAPGGTVALTWSTVTPPGEPAPAYYVTRDGGKPAGNCPEAAAPAAVTTCTDAGVPVGDHTYQVIAVWRTWTATSAAKAAKVTIGPVAKFTVAASATSIAAGGSTNLTITARDEADSTVTSYSGSHSLVFTGAEAAAGGTKPTVSNSSGTATAFGTATAISFTAGVATVVSTTKNGVARLYQAGTASIVASEGSVTTPSPPTITVTPLVATKFFLAAASATPTAGAADALTVTAQDTYGNTATSYSGSHSLVFSGASPSPSGNTPTVSDSSGADLAFGTATAISFAAGVAKASEGSGGTMKLYKSGLTSVKATEGAILTPTAVAVTVAASSADKLSLSSSTATPVASANFNLTTTALDAYGNTATSYSGPKTITFSGASPSPSGAIPTVVNSAGTPINFGSATALTFTSGVAAVSASKNGLAKLTKAGSTSVSASDGTIATPTPLVLTVSAGAASRLAMNAVTSSAGTIGTPCLFTCSITSLGNAGAVKGQVAITDSAGNIVTNLGAKSIALTVSAGGNVVGSPLSTAATGPAISTSEFTYTAPSNGSFTHTITAASSGYTSATATASK